jgi:pimeloyl-ACP methyl ester carboxylesterase
MLGGMTFVLIPGAGGAAWYWHRVVPLLTAAGHDAIAVDLPGDDGRAGLDVYAERVVDAAGSRNDAVLVASRWAASRLRSCASACRSGPSSS